MINLPDVDGLTTSDGRSAAQSSTSLSLNTTARIESDNIINMLTKSIIVAGVIKNRIRDEGGPKYRNFDRETDAGELNNDAGDMQITPYGVPTYHEGRHRGR